MEPPDEYRLALLARDGDFDALSRLAELARPSLFAAAYAELRHFDDAQDAVAMALLRVCRHIGALRDPGQARAWMARVARNEARRLRRPAPAIAAEPATPGSGPALLRLDVERALRALPRDQARAAALFYLDGLSVAEIAAQLGRPAGTVKYWLFRSRAHLTARLEGYAPMETATSINAALFSSELAPEFVARLTDALTAAGFAGVRFVRDFAALGRLEPLPDAAGQPRLTLVNPAPDCRCLVLDARMDGHSAFEIARLLRATPEGKDAALFLLGDGAEGETESHLTALSAYMAGFDMCLMKPFDLDEFRGFARRLHGHLANGPGA